MAITTTAIVQEYGAYSNSEVITALRLLNKLLKFLLPERCY